MSRTAFTLLPDEIEFTAIRAQGAGGQNVNKVSSAIHLRFDIRASSLPELLKHRLLNLHDQRITREGIVVIKAQNHRTQERNREEALLRLHELVESVSVTTQGPARDAADLRLESASARGQDPARRGQGDTRTRHGLTDGGGGAWVLGPCPWSLVLGHGSRVTGHGHGSRIRVFGLWSRVLVLVFGLGIRSPDGKGSLSSVGIRLGKTQREP